jgi:hypothetical protein
MLLQWGNKHLAKALLSGHAIVAANKRMETVLSLTFRTLPMYCTSSKHKNKLEGNRLR